ncbi:hypothetical protein K435DRAFT_861311 [Dendrothele bispora CBS 962.96]|uniref:Uncharacterized protein n=1 Tax=Dendrothele bispora (strain CBS 962.96) TaxID=1314807 RepID=A0A4S8LX30_DENBC|nr:hypothetical protein K435DRAFT_861311 [Dendrothele bispora CBS 962.96]
MTGNNDCGSGEAGGGGGGLGPGGMAGMNKVWDGVLADRESISSSGSGAMGGSRYHPEFVDAEEEDLGYTESGPGKSRQVLQPLSTSFNQRGAGSPPQRIIEEDEILSNNSNAPYPVASHPYPGAGPGGGSTSGSGN